MSVQGAFELGSAVEAPPRKHSTTFTGNMALPVHRWFRYSAGFAADWVASVLQGSSEARVIDPFAGSGTTLIASQGAAAESIGVESQPFVARVAQAKLHWTSDVDRFLRRAHEIARHHSPVAPSGPQPPLLEKCFTPPVLADLLGLRDQILADDSEAEIHALLWLAFVAIIRKTSHVGTAQWQYVLPNKAKHGALPVLDAFHRQVTLMSEDMRTRQRTLNNPPASKLIQADARTPGVVQDAWATHVICSPPYANNYDYADATRLEQTVLGEVSGWGDLKEMRSKLVRSCSQAMSGYSASQAIEDPILRPIIGELHQVYKDLARVKTQHGGRKAYDDMILAYFHDLAQVWKALRKATVEGAEVCFVIGDSAPYGVHVPVERWLGKLALASGFNAWHFEKIRDRNVKWKNRKHDVPLHEGNLWVIG